MKWLRQRYIWLTKTKTAYVLDDQRYRSIWTVHSTHDGVHIPQDGRDKDTSVTRGNEAIESSITAPSLSTLAPVPVAIPIPILLTYKSIFLDKDRFKQQNV